ncbi:MarR family transcriptional regulator [Sphingomonas bacterium]|uniref:MarR family transcriptional regulator n=1 Tax=Sphingomonas bacterium TaxID=1895847 RepID=UPI0015759A72|nr:MarR family transcriptional regulator [Sphingomonas bacterium]
MSARRHHARAPGNATRVDPSHLSIAAVRALALPDPLGEAIETLIAFGMRVASRADAPDPAAPRLAGRLHRQLLALPTLFDGTVSADPAFTMLLALVADEESDRATTVSDLARASGAPATTALRHLDRLEAHGLVIRRADPRDRRRTLVTLTDTGRQGVEQAMAALIAASR